MIYNFSKEKVSKEKEFHLAKKDIIKKTKPKKAIKKEVDAGQESLAKELRGLIPKLDSQGLAFLVKQARIHLYNMQVEELNKAASAVNVSSQQSNSIAKKSSVGGKTNSAEGSIIIQETQNGKSYYLRYQNKSSIFSLEEMICIVKIANGSGTDLEIRERLYNWFVRERKDFFGTIPIADKFDARLKTLLTLLKKTFKLRNNS